MPIILTKISRQKNQPWPLLTLPSSRQSTRRSLTASPLSIRTMESSVDNRRPTSIDLCCQSILRKTVMWSIARSRLNQGYVNLHTFICWTSETIGGKYKRAGYFQFRLYHWTSWPIPCLSKSSHIYICACSRNIGRVFTFRHMVIWSHLFRGWSVMKVYQ